MHCATERDRRDQLMAERRLKRSLAVSSGATRDFLPCSEGTTNSDLALRVNVRMNNA
jgi:hypothetical protein